MSADILLLDIETIWMEAKGIWDLRTEYISPSRITRDWSILCWGAKWLFEPEVMGQVVRPDEAISRSEESVIGGIWELMNKADIVITQNGIGFDIPRLNTKFAKHGYPPPKPYKNVDTLKAARSALYLPSYKLDFIAKYIFGYSGKIPMTEKDWDECSEGNPEALEKMLTYCKHDIAPLLEDWYLYLRPWIKGHPNLNLYTDHDGDVCPKCESQNLKWDHEYTTPQGLWEGFRCQACGATGRGTTKDRKEKSVQIVPT